MQRTIVIEGPALRQAMDEKPQAGGALLRGHSYRNGPARGSGGRLTGGGSAASPEAKRRGESAAPAG